MSQIGRDQYNYSYISAGSPRQVRAALPAGPARLVGRRDELAQLLQFLAPPRRGAPTETVWAVCGLAGIGKTALAVHAAREASVVRDWFSGGVLFVNLRGYDPQGRVTGQQAVAVLLRALGVGETEMPPSSDEQAALYRSEMARIAAQTGSILLIADNASTASQVHPLLPACPEHRLLVTSRDTLASIPARQISLGELHPADAGELIASTLAQARPDDPRALREPEALSELAAYCGGLPLALEIGAARLSSDPGLPIADLAAQLAVSQARLSALHYDDGGQDLSVRAAFDESYWRLYPAPAELFRLLSLNPGPDISTQAASALLGRPARAELSRLARAALLREDPVGSGRWRMHDLLRLYADELAQEAGSTHQVLNESTGRQAREAFEGLLQYYETTLREAVQYLWEYGPNGMPGRFRDRQDAVAWLEAERPNLITTVRRASARHLNTAVSMAHGLCAYLTRFRYFDDCVSMLRLLLPLALPASDTQSTALLHNWLGVALGMAGRTQDAAAELRESAQLFRGLGRDEPDTELHLGRVLSNLSNCEDTARARRAAGEEAVAIGRRWPQQSEQWLSGALENLSKAYADLGQNGQAVDCAREAVEIRREQTVRTPGLYEHVLAEVLVSLAERLLTAGAHEESVVAAQEGVKLYNALAADNAGPFEPLLPHALSVLGLGFAGLGRWKHARDAHDRAVSVTEKLGYTADALLCRLDATLGRGGV